MFRTTLSAFVALALFTSASFAGLFNTTQVPLNTFGFATGGRASTLSEYVAIYDVARNILGNGAVVRTGLGWDPTQQNIPSFNNWSAEVLQPALARNIRVLPSIRTQNLQAGGLRYPTDAQWTNGLREIVKMYGPNGIYHRGGTYIFKGRTVNVAPHPEFAGLTDFEIWNEPNMIGNINGTMTPAMTTHLLRLASITMRDQAARQGFTINIIGPAIGGINLPYLRALKEADPNLFTYVNTVTFHGYTKSPPSMCSTTGPAARHCVKTFEAIRSYMNANGGLNVHLGTTEGGVAGDRGGCTGPQVRSEEQQRDYSTENLLWLRGRPYLKMDFFITTFPIDTSRRYAYACDSGRYDSEYWISKLGVVRADGSVKPWGVRWRELVAMWR
jgi:hypothetical protein